MLQPSWSPDPEALPELESAPVCQAAARRPVRLTAGRAQTRPDMKPDLTVEESTEKHLALIHRLTTADSGKYFSAAKDGAELPY